MGAAYQTVSQRIQAELDRIRAEASAISEGARQALDRDIDKAVAEEIAKDKTVTEAIKTRMRQIIQAWDAS